MVASRKGAPRMAPTATSSFSSSPAITATTAMSDSGRAVPTAASRLPTTPWLTALVGRKGWRHYMLKRRGAVVAVRSLFISEGAAWSGIDAPVPGIMAPSFDLDAMLGERLVRDGIAAGAKLFVADIEAPRPDRDGPAYRNYDRLGFKLAYLRNHYSYLPAHSS